MAEGYGTTPEEMQRASARVLQVNEQVQGQLAALRNQLVPVAGGWRGEASTAFQGLMARWDADARTLNEALRGIGDALLASGRTYQATEEQHARGMSAIRGALG